MNHPRFASLRLLPLLLVACSAPAQAVDFEQFCGKRNLSVAHGETTSGDKYFWSKNATIAGTHEGDLIGGAGAVAVTGEVDGDLVLMGQSIEVTGQVRDSARFWGQTVTITGVVEGDVMAFAVLLNIHPQAHITGNVIAFGGQAILDGTIDGEVLVTAGEITVNGTIGRDARLKADAIEFGSQARIGGDLRYTARKPLDPEPADAVVGRITFEEKRDDEDDDDEDGMTLRSFLFWSWWLLAAILVGSIALVLGRRWLPGLTRPIAAEPMLSALIGFGTFLVVPALLVLALVLVISIPLSVIGLWLFLIALYLAKMPVALWLGERILARLGAAAASPFAALGLGLLLLYLSFEIPYVGVLAWLVTTWLGLGTLILAARERARGVRAGTAGAD